MEDVVHCETLSATKSIVEEYYHESTVFETLEFVATGHPLAYIVVRSLRFFSLHPDFAEEAG